jgi:hypothetical protein
VTRATIHCERGASAQFAPFRRGGDDRQVRRTARLSSRSSQRIPACRESPDLGGQRRYRVPPSPRQRPAEEAHDRRPAVPVQRTGRPDARSDLRRPARTRSPGPDPHAVRRGGLAGHPLRRRPRGARRSPVQPRRLAGARRAQVRSRKVLRDSGVRRANVERSPARRPPNPGVTAGYAGIRAGRGGPGSVRRRPSSRWRGSCSPRRSAAASPPRPASSSTRRCRRSSPRRAGHR